MKRALLILTALCMIFMHGMPYTKAVASGEELKLSLPLEGSWGPADDSQASFVYRLPQFETNADSTVQINQFYQQLLISETNVRIDENILGVDFELTSINERYLSIMLHWTVEAGQGLGEIITADTFALDGVYAGQKITLSELLGLEVMSDEQGLNETVWKLVWQIVEREMQNAEGDYLGNLGLQDVMTAFCPETDFYLDDNGNIQFYIQSGILAGEIAGVLTFPFAPSELLDAHSSDV